MLGVLIMYVYIHIHIALCDGRHVFNEKVPFLKCGHIYRPMHYDNNYKRVSLRDFSY